MPTKIFVSVITTYLNDNAQTPLNRLLVYMLYNQVCNKQIEPMVFRPNLSVGGLKRRKCDMHIALT